MRTEWAEILKRDGVSKIECPFSEETLKRWNSLMDPIFHNIRDMDRSYATLEDLYKLGIFEEFFSAEMRSILKTVMPDPALLCFHAYEIKGRNEKNHVFGEAFNGWHRDIAELPGLQAQDPNFVSLFIYLTDVKNGDGEFEIIQKSFTGPAMDNDSSLKMIGPVGTTFLWNRTLLHRASPNLSPDRRRVLKISFQHNYLQNEHIETETFKKVRSLVTEPYLKFLLGEKHHDSPVGYQAPFSGDYVPKNIPLISNAKVKIAFIDFVKGLWWFVRREKRPFGP